MLLVEPLCFFFNYWCTAHAHTCPNTKPTKGEETHTVTNSVVLDMCCQKYTKVFNPILTALHPPTLWADDREPWISWRECTLFLMSNPFHSHVCHKEWILLPHHTTFLLTRENISYFTHTAVPFFFHGHERRGEERRRGGRDRWPALITPAL